MAGAVVQGGAGATVLTGGVGPLLATVPGPAVDAAFAAVTPDTVAKVLFTSGSTGAPKGVINTQRMLCANQQIIARCWPFLSDRPPVILDWLPWSHTFGCNHNFNLMLRHGGTLYVDDGRPAPGRVDATVRNLHQVSPTLFFNVPRGYAMLLDALERDPSLTRRFLAELDVVFYAAAALPESSWVRMKALVAASGGRRPAMISAWGLTETAPMATCVHYAIERAGNVGVPPPGGELALVPVGDGDEGYINQRAVLVRRAALVAQVYAEPPDPSVIVI